MITITAEVATTLTGTATVTISDDDLLPTQIDLSLNPASVAEGSLPTSITVTAAFPEGYSTLASDTVVTVAVGDSGDSATEGTDYAEVGDLTLTIPARESSVTGEFLFEVIDDGIIDSGETVSVSGTTTTEGLTIMPATLTLTITDDDVAGVTITGTSLTVAEGAGTGTEATYTVELDTQPAGEVEVTIDPGTSTTAPVSITPSLVLTFTPMNWSEPQTVTVVATEDGDEVGGTRTLEHAVANYPGVTSADPVVVTVTDSNPAGVTITGTGLRVGEGMTASYTVQLDTEPAGQVLVTIVPDSTVMTAPVSITPSLVLTFASGTWSTPQTVTVEATEDGDGVGGSRTLEHAVSGYGSVTTADPVRVVVTDNDPVPRQIDLSLDPATVTEASVSTSIMVTAAFPDGSATLVSDTVVTVAVGGVGNTAGDPATEGADYDMVGEVMVTIPMGMTSGTGSFPFVVVEDTDDEPDETVAVSGITTASGFSDGVTAATLTITDNDTPPMGIELSLSPDSVTEGDSGTTRTQVAVTVTLTGGGTRALPTEVTVSVAGGGTNPATAGGNVVAVDDADFAVVPDFTFSIPSSTTSFTRMFPLDVIGDTLVEGDETLMVTGSADLGGGGPAATAQAELTIDDDDTAPEMIILSLGETDAVSEGASATVTVTASFPPDSTTTLASETVVTVTVGDSGDSATEGTDYTMVDVLMVTIRAGESRGTGEFQFTATDDTVVDPGEMVTVSGTSGSFIFTNTSLAITDTDTAPTMIILSLGETGAVSEGTSATVTVTAAFPGGSPTLTSDTVVTVAVGDSGDTATEEMDYTMVDDLMVTIRAGESRGTGEFQFTATDDTVVDPGEMVTVSGTSGSFSFTDTSLAITDTDMAPRRIDLSLSTDSVMEASGTTGITVTAAFPPGSPTLTSDTVVTVAVGDGGDSATEGTDYTTVGDLTLTIQAGASSVEGTFAFVVANDSVDELDETVTISGTLTASGFPDGVSAAQLTITDDDTAVLTLSFDRDAVFETEPTVDFRTVLLEFDPPLTEPAPITYRFNNPGDTATWPADYNYLVSSIPAVSSSFSPSNPIPAGTATASFIIVLRITRDGVTEDPEFLTLSATVPGYNTVMAATLTIADTGARITLDDVEVDEDAGMATVAATLNGAVSGGLTATVSIADGTATVGEDYMVPTTTELIFTGRATEVQEFTMPIVNDSIAEGDETFTVSVSGVSGNAVVVDSSDTATVTIINDDFPPTEIALSLSEAGASEGASATVTVTAAFPGGSPTLTSDTVVTVAVGADDDTATERADYTMVGDLTLTIQAGASSVEGTFLFAALDDDIADPDETVSVSGTADGFDFTDTSLAITDTDTAPTEIVLSLGETGAVAEGASATVTVTATLSPDTTTLGSDTVVTVAVGAGDDSATEEQDYTMVGDLTLTIAAEATSGTVEFEFAVTDDDIDESDETVTVSGIVPAASGIATVSDATLTINDNDTAGVTVTPTTLTAAEEGPEQTYTVVLDTQPAGEVEVTIDPGSGPTAPITVTPGGLVLTFDPGTWATAQTVTVTATADDDALDGTRTLEHAVANYPGVTSADPVVVTVTDNDDAGVTVTPTTLTAAEEGPEQTYTVVLDTQPAGEVEVTIDPGSGPTAPITVTPGGLVLTFDTGTWATAQTVTVTATADDDALDGTRTLEHAVANYPGVTSADPVVVTVTDDDDAGVTVTPTILTAAEEGPEQTYTVVLDTQPVGEVEITIDPGSGPTAPITVTPGLVLSFDSGTWATAQTVTVTAIADDDALDGTRTLEHAVANYPEVTSAGPVVVTVTDDDDAGVTITPTALTAAEEGAEQTYTVVLDTQPAGEVEITIDPGSGPTAPITVTPGLVLTFDSGTWATAQTVTVTATADADALDGTRTLEHAVANYPEVTSAGPVVVTVTDDDDAGVTITPTALTAAEEGPEQTYTVMLDTQPAGEVEVTIDPGSGPTAPITVTPGLVLTFDSGTWATAQTVTVTATADTDALDGTRTLEHAVANYPGVTSAGPVVVTVTDDDDAGVTITPTALTAAEEGPEQTYTVVLDTQPAGEVVVTIDPGSGPTAPITVTPGLVLTFDTGTWATAQTVTVTATADTDALDGTRTLEHAVANYPGVTRAGPVVVTVTDDDDAGVTITPTALAAAEEGPEQTYTVVLDTQPAGEVVVTIDPGSGPTAPITVTPGLVLTFDTGTWATAQTVTVTATADADALDGTRTLEHAVANYPGVTSADPVVVTVTDNDDVGVTVTPTALTAAEEGPEQTYTVVLDTQPVGEVEVTIDPGSGPTAPITVTPGGLVLTFDTGTWATAQTVTVTATADDDALDGTRTLEHAVANYPGVTRADPVVVTVTDNDDAGVTVTPTALTAAEEGPEQTYTVVLDTQPAGEVEVTIDPGSGPTAPITVTPGLVLTFDTGTWATAQTVTVTATADDDALDGTRTLEHAVANYPGVTRAGPVVVTVTDNDDAGVTITPTALTAAEEGAEQTYTVVLDTQPAGEVEITIDPGSGPTAPITVTPGLVLTFDSGTWATAQTVTVTATADTDALDGTRTLEHAVANYPGVTSADPVVVTVTDDDDAGVTITPTALAAAEEGPEQTYTVVLDTQPAGEVVVTIDPGSGPTAPITVTPGLVLTFDTGTWATAQTVTVTATADDDALDGTRTLEHAVANYPGVTSADPVVVTVTDNDDAGVTVTPTTLTAAEEGPEQTYTVVLDTQPAGEVEVTIDPGSGPTAPITVTPGGLVLTFDPGTWATAQTVTVTATADDDALDGTRTLEHAVANYPGVTSADPVVVTVTDNDDAGVTVTPTTLTAAEEGPEQTYTVVLDTQPAGEVEVTIDPGSGPTAPITVTPGGLVLTFDTGTWATAQTVTVTATADDDALDGTRTLEHAVANYPGVTSADPVVVTVTDDDDAGVTVTPTILTAAEEGPEQTYTVVLDTQPAGEVEVTIDPGSGPTAPITVTPGLVLTFDTGTWATAQTVTVTATADDDALDGTRTLEHAVANYPGVTSADPVVVTVTDNDTAGVTVSESALAVNEGAQQTYTVVLNSAPAGTATVTIVEDSSSTAPLTVTPSTLTLEFDSGNWDSAQTVTVAADEDDDAAGGTRTLGHTVTGYGSVTTAASVVVTVTDNDTAGVTITPTTLTAHEGGAQQTYMVRLNTAPAGTATVTIVPTSTTAPISVTPATLTLTFDASTWNTAQPVTVSAGEDDDVEGGTQTLEHTVTGYGSVATAASVVVTVTDNDTAGVTVTPTTLAVDEGTQQTYTVVLNSPPSGTATVTIVEDSSSTAPLTVTPSTLTLEFDSGNWDSAQTVTVAADEDDDTAGGTRTLGHTVTGYGSVATAASVVVTVIDNDRPGVTISESALAVTEEGPEQTYTVVLDTQPAGEVEVTLDPGSSTTAPITVTPGGLVLTFDTGTWATAQTVTATATADDDAEGGTRTLSHTVSGYGSVATAAPVTVTVTDDDVLTPIALYLDPATVAEDIGRMTITVMAALPEGSPAMATATEVEVQVMDGTAIGGTDFIAGREFTVTIAENTTSGMASFDVTLIHDAQVEGDETLMVVGEAVGHTVTPATLTISDRSSTFLAALGTKLLHEVFAGVSDAVADRVNRLIKDRLSASVSGFDDLQASFARGLAANQQALNDGNLSWRKLLDGSFLAVPLGDGADTVPLSDSGQSGPAGFGGLWAAGEARSLSDDSGDFGAWDSDLFFTHIGVDIPVGRGMGGMAVSSSRGSFNFERDEFDTDTRLLNHTLYYGMPVGDRGGVWALIGYGTGELVTEQGGNRNTHDMKMTMVAAGGRRNIAWEDGLALDFEGEVWAGRLIPEDADDDGDFATEINRLNFALDLERRWKNDAGVSFVRSIKLEAQLDDRAPGSGAAIKGRLGHSNPASGMTSSLTGDFRLFNEEGLKGGGVSGSLLYRPDIHGRGPSFRADSSYSAGKTDLSRQWRDSGIMAGDSSRAEVFELETGYGLSVLGGYGVLTPYYGFEFTGEGARRHRLGNRVRISQALELEIEGAYLENVPGEHAERRLDLRLRMQW